MKWKAYVTWRKERHGKMRRGLWNQISLITRTFRRFVSTFAVSWKITSHSLLFDVGKREQSVCHIHIPLLRRIQDWVLVSSNRLAAFLLGQTSATFLRVWKPGQREGRSGHSICYCVVGIALLSTLPGKCFSLWVAIEGHKRWDSVNEAEWLSRKRTSVCLRFV